jgi:hypothetical protein
MSEPPIELNEQTDIQLIIDKDDVIVKRYMKGQNTAAYPISGMTFTTGLELDGALAYTTNGTTKLKLPTTLQSDKHTINIQFSNPIPAGRTYFYELHLLLNSNTVLQIGRLKVIDWPKEDLSQIILMPNAGQLLFSSAMGKVVVHPRLQYRVITPGLFSKKLISHAQNAGAIRLEWGMAPRITLHMEYTIQNLGTQQATDFTLQSFIPPTTKFQQVILPNGLQTINDHDENQLAMLKIDTLRAGEQKQMSVDLQIQSLGNARVIMPNFGTWPEFREIAQPGTIGDQMTAASKYWPLHDADIKNLVQLLKKNAINASQFIELAFEFVNQKIKYQINNQRDDAATTLRNRTGDCSEYSDLFVAILRGAKIPAKIIHGWTFHLKSYELTAHAWCEFFAPKQGWLACDPTWGFLTGVSSQHIARHREGIVSEQNTYSWKYRGNTEVQVKEVVTIKIIQ